MNTIYLDNGATSWPKAPTVASTLASFITEEAVNIGRGGYDRAYETAGRIDECREKLGAFFGAPEDRNVTFSLNVTHALNTLIAGLFTKDDHVLVSGMEHNAVMRPLSHLDIPYSIIPCDREGRIHLEQIPHLINGKTKAIIMTQASNVTGTIQPIKELSSIAGKYGLLLLIDAAQLPLSNPLSIIKDNLDAIAFTGHKSLLGPQGVGGLVLSDRLAKEVKPWRGGTGSKSDLLEMPDFLPDKFEAGTQNLPESSACPQRWTLSRTTASRSSKRIRNHRASAFLFPLRQTHTSDRSEGHEGSHERDQRRLSNLGQCPDRL